MTVLNVVECTNSIYWVFLVTSIIIVICGIVSLFTDHFSLAQCLLIIGCMWCVWSIYAVGTHKPHKEYQVIIDEKTTFHEIYDKYDVVKQEGYIYTLVDKEKEK